MMEFSVLILIMVQQLVFGQINSPDAGTGEVKCPKIACHLHNFPDEHCKVQAFFVYHGITCEGCVEDKCHGSKTAAGSHIGSDVLIDNMPHTDVRQSHATLGNDVRQRLQRVTDMFTRSSNINNVNGLNNGYVSRRPVVTMNNHPPRQWNRLREIQSRLMRQQIPVQQHGSGLILDQLASQQRPLTKGVRLPQPKNEIRCPRLECSIHHHVPEDHCMVETYFLHQGRRCTGCTEDICLGAHTVSESLIGKNETDLHNIGLTSSKVNSEIIMPSRPPSLRLTNTNGNGLRNQLDRINSNQIANNVPRTNTIRSNTFGRRQEFDTLPSWQNNRNSPFSSVTNQDSSTRSQSALSTGQVINIGKEVIADEPTPQNTKRGIHRYTGRAKSYLESLFHTSFTS